MIKIDGIKECDRIKTKDGRIGTVMLIMQDINKNIGLEVEYHDTAPETETIDITYVIEVIK